MGKEIDQGLMAALASWFGRRMFQRGLELSAQSITKVMSDRAIHTTGAAGRVRVERKRMANQQIAIYVLGARDSSVVRLVKDINSAHDTDIQILGFIDQNWRDLPRYFHGFPVLQNDPNPRMPRGNGIHLVNSVASSMRERAKVTSLWQQSGLKFMNLVHPSVNLEMVEMGQGNLILEGFLGPGTRIGDHNVVRSGGFVGHDSAVGDHCFVGPNATLCGEIRLDDKSFIGAGATVLPRLRIGDGAIVGAAALVTKDVLPGETVVGVPAKERIGGSL